MTPSFAELNLGGAFPAISLMLGTCVLLIADLFVPKERKEITGWLAMIGVVVSFVVNLLVFNTGGETFLGMYIADSFTGFLNMVILITAFLSILISIDYTRRYNILRGEYYMLMLFSTAGMMLMAGANDLVLIFVALELLSIPLYVLAAFRSPDLKSEESGMKYFVLGAFSSAFFVYGAALVYGATGSTSLPEIFASVSQIVVDGGTAAVLLLLGAGLIIVGLGFKVAVVPFHMWTPDVYEGAPTPITAFMSVGAKAGGFAALLRVLVVALVTFTVQEGQSAAAWQTVVWIIAAATLILGNIVAISQVNIKRMLAYSSIAHAGYILMAVAAAGTTGVSDMATRGALIYLMAYMFTNLGAFAVVMCLEREDGGGSNLNDFIGLSKTQPLLAAAMAVFMLSLTGIPLTGGFIGKWFVFQATLEAGLVPLAIIGVLTSVVSAFYYVRVIVNMYLREPEGEPADVPHATPYVTWAVYGAFAATVILGIFPVLVTSLTEGVVLAASILP